ncbi:MAG: clostripain-related cysteine peptidase [Caldilineaceae bacterium]
MPGIMRCMRPVRNRLWLIVSLFLLLGLGALPAAAAPPAQMDEAEWLIMVYSVADDNVLEEDMMFDLQEMELVGSSAAVHIVAQVDRYDGAFDGMGDFISTKRFYITQDDDVNEISSEEIADLGEVNMADGESLYDFILWATANFPASKRMLILSDHGSGWPGGFGDPDPGVSGADDIFLVDMFGVDNLWLMEIDRTLEAALADSGIGQLDVVGFDACLMAQIEVFTALAPHALYSVASQETEPSLGWAYVGFLDALMQNPGMDGAGLTTAIVESYINQDIRLYDPNFAGGLAPEQVAQELFHDVTLSAVDLSAVADLNTAIDAFAAALGNIDQRVVATARSYARSYESVFGEDWPSPYIDLGNFAELVAQNSNNADVQAAAQDLLSALQAAVIAETHGEGRRGSNGIAIYFPVPNMFGVADNFGYTTVAARFAESTNWDEFLAFHAGGGAAPSFNRPQNDPAYQVQQQNEELASEDVDALLAQVAALLEEGYSPEDIAAALLGEGFDEEFVAFLLENNILAQPTTPSAPPASVSKPVRVDPISLSAEVAYPGEPVTVSSVVGGSNLAFLYTFIGRFLPAEDVLIIEDMDFIFSDANQEAGDVIYPVWPDEEFEVGYEWEPTVYAISDGETSLRVLFMPDTYGDSPTYTVDGVYAFADGSPDRYATLYFRDGELERVLSFTGDAANSAGAPWEIRPQPGDSVTVLQQGINLAANAEDEDYSRAAGTLTFGDEPLFIETTPAPSGNYVVGIIAEDLDGETYESYETIFVVNDDAAAEDGYVPFVDEDLLFALLHPEDWTAFSDQGYAVLINADENGYVQIEQYVFEEPTSVSDARAFVLEDAVNRLAGDEFGLSDVSFGDEPVGYALGAFNGQWLDFSADWDGTPVSGGVVVAAPTPSWPTCPS